MCSHIHINFPASYHSVEVAVDHQRRPPAQVDIVLPPIRDVVRGPPGLHHQVALEFLSNSRLEFSSQPLHSGVLLLIQQWLNRMKILKVQ